MQGFVHVHEQQEHSADDVLQQDHTSYNNSYNQNRNNKGIDNKQCLILGNHSYVSPKSSTEDRENKIHCVELKGSTRCSNDDTDGTEPFDGFKKISHADSSPKERNRTKRSDKADRYIRGCHRPTSKKQLMLPSVPCRCAKGSCT